MINPNTHQVNSQSQTRVKLNSNRVFISRCLFQVRSLGCDFATPHRFPLLLAVDIRLQGVQCRSQLEQEVRRAAQALETRGHVLTQQLTTEEQVSDCEWGLR